VCGLLQGIDAELCAKAVQAALVLGEGPAPATRPGVEPHQGPVRLLGQGVELELAPGKEDRLGELPPVREVGYQQP